MKHEDAQALPADEGRLEPTVRPLAALVEHLRAEADFNASWADGRRGTYVSEAYAAHRRNYARKLADWADDVERLTWPVCSAEQAQIEAPLRDEIARLKETVRVYDKRIVALGCLALESAHRDTLAKNCGELARREVAAALPAMREYARGNPVHHVGETPQDPNGVHAWLARNERPTVPMS